MNSNSIVHAREQLGALFLGLNRYGNTALLVCDKKGISIVLCGFQLYIAMLLLLPVLMADLW